MDITVGTFNLNNLFSRYNFKGEVDAIHTDDTSVDSEIKYEFDQNKVFKLRTYRGRLVKAKKAIDTQRVVGRIKQMNLDILAVQEVEDIDTLKEFNRKNLNGMYKYLVLVEGNDPRLIDVGVMSKLPVGGITSWQHATHSDEPDKPVFGRDLLEVEIYNTSRSRRLFTVFNNHLKSHFVAWYDDQVTGEQSNNKRRAHQSEIMAEIIKASTRPNSNFIVLGDMNDPPDSDCLDGFINDNELDLTNGLINPVETRPPKSDTPMPANSSWTHRYKESGCPAEYSLYDQIWLSPAIAGKQIGAWIDRRKRHGGDGSDHDPAWVKLQI